MKDEPIIREKPQKKNRMQLKLLLFLLVALSALVAAPYYFLFHSQGEEIALRTYRYAPVDTRTFVRRLSIGGLVEPERVIMVKSPLSGDVTELQVAAGSQVVEGQLLAVLESEELEEEIQKTRESILDLERKIHDLVVQREIEERKKNLDLHLLTERRREAIEDLKLKEKLFELGTISLKELEQAKTTLKSVEVEEENTKKEQILQKESYERELLSLEEELRGAKRGLSSLLEKLEEASMLSPMDGMIMEVFKKEGQSVISNDDLFQIMDLESSVVILKVGENDIARIRRDHEALVRVADTTVKGRITFISPQTERTSDGPVVEVHISLEEIPSNLRAFSTAVAEFELARRENVPFLPRGDYLTSGEYSFVYVIDDNTATRRAVSFGQHEGTFIEVLSGLEVGEVIITSSYEEFKDRREIRINPEGGRAH